MNSTVLAVRELTKKIGRHSIVNEVSFEIRRGEIVGLVGPNGAGKTTIIRMIAGLIAFTSGDIEINGYCIKKDMERALASVGGIIETPQFYNHMTGYQNLQLHARIYPDASIDIGQTLKRLELEEAMFKKVSSYSLGMRQRLGLAQALLHKPGLLLLDEPTNGLDPDGIHDLRHLLKDMRSSGTSILISSHHLTELDLICDRILVIRKGALCGDHFLQELRSVTAKDGYLLEVDEAEQAVRAVAEFDPALRPQHKERGVLEIRMERERIPDLLGHLHNRGIAVYQIKKETTSIESYYTLLAGQKESVGESARGDVS
ncbi:ABC transporter ATP-binding protein [Paenibacillus chartarius]|uniref:ABC transporter ATP-binding protein n=1 Tax=Paenibacillus chartarius TaxID=747481 RepID=A0ABV6DKW9_9BACL